MALIYKNENGNVFFFFRHRERIGKKNAIRYKLGFKKTIYRRDIFTGEIKSGSENVRANKKINVDAKTHSVYGS